MKKISIIGFGSFGKVLYRLIKKDFKITLYDKNGRVFEGTKIDKKDKIAKSVKDAYKNPIIFFAIPIESFEKTIKDHKKYFNNHLLIDVLSVKEHPFKIFKKYLKDANARAILTHPMFGPDSSKNGFKNLVIVLNNFNAKNEEYRFWKKYFSGKKLKVVELTAKEHDKIAANSQGVTHFVGRLLKEFNVRPTSIDTLGAKKLQEIIEQTCHSSWQLFLNLQNYNSFTKQMRIKLGDAHDKLYNRLLPERISPNYIIYGIQGGKGSFNEKAITEYTKKNKIKNYKIKYLYTSRNVLKNLHAGKVDFGLFAIHNSVGGMVEESVEAMSSYRFNIVEEFSVLVEHFLMKRKNVGFKQIKTIMAHPQVFKQCISTLKNKYPAMILKSGKGNLITTSEVAKLLSRKRLPRSTAVLGPKILGEMYDLEITDNHLQDNKKNYTNFLLVSR